jgi:hypothetical protein
MIAVFISFVTSAVVVIKLSVDRSGRQADRGPQAPPAARDPPAPAAAGHHGTAHPGRPQSCY